MSEKNYKVSMIVSISIALVAAIYLLVRVIVDLATPEYLSQTWDILNWISISLLIVSLIIALAIVLVSALSSKKDTKKEINRSKEAEILRKYASRK